MKPRTGRNWFKTQGNGAVLPAVFVLFVFLTANAAAQDGMPASEERPWQVAAILERTIGNSHTSYEFGNPFLMSYSPLSRLEFPINTWWGGVELRREFSRCSLGGRLLTNVTQNTDGDMRDSDWEDESRPDRLTTYSVSRSSMEPSIQARCDIDLKIADWLGLPSSMDIRPVIGFQWQRFNMMVHDGTQWEYLPSNDPVPLPGNSLHFRQEYQLYFLGFRAKYEWGKTASGMRPYLFLFGYRAHVRANNEDHHMLRAGYRLTYDKTTGGAWFIAGGARAPVGKNLAAVLEMSYLNIRTTGAHRLYNELLEQDFSFDYGVEVWSQQTALGLRLEYVF